MVLRRQKGKRRAAEQTAGRNETVYEREVNQGKRYQFNSAVRFGAHGYRLGRRRAVAAGNDHCRSDGVKPAAFWAVKLTKTEKDDAFVKRLYDCVEGTAIDWKPYVALFRRRNPKAAEVLDKFRIADKDKDELSSDT